MYVNMYTYFYKYISIYFNTHAYTLGILYTNQHTLIVLNSPRRQDTRYSITMTSAVSTDSCILAEAVAADKDSFVDMYVSTVWID